MRELRAGEAHIEVWADAPALIARAGQLFAEKARHAVSTEGRFTVALSGGSTPRALYQRLAAAVEPDAPGIPWRDTHIFWSDERCVPPSSQDSNYRMAYDALLGRVHIPAEQIHRMRGEDEPARAALDYEKLLEEQFEKTPPRFNLMLLGVGEDGHTASLFPYSAGLEETKRLVASPFIEKLRAHRLTMTPGAINAARTIMFLVTGRAKAETLRAVLEGERDPRRYPAQLVEPDGGQLIWLVDEAAASLLSPGNGRAH